MDKGTLVGSDCPSNEGNACSTSLLFDLMCVDSPDNQFIMAVQGERFVVHWANKALESAMGIPHKKFKGKTLPEMLGDTIGASLEENYRKCFNSKKPYDYEETTLDSKNGSTHWHTLLIPVFNDARQIKYICGSSRNVTRLKVEAESNKKDSQSKVHLLAHMSHEVRTPLHTIGGAVSILKNGQLTESQKSLIDVIELSLQPLKRLSDDMLSFFRMQESKFDLQISPCNVQNLAQEVYEEISIAANAKGVNLVINNSHNLQYLLLGDGIRIKQILTNLMSNAVKFTSEGRVEFTISNRVVNGEVSVTFDIKDEGIGIHQGDMDKLFIKYSRLKNALENNIEGTGLGLAITKELVERMGGTVTASNNVGQGATFSATIPFKIASKLESNPS